MDKNDIAELMPIIYDMAAGMTTQSLQTALKAIIISESGVEDASEYFKSFQITHVKDHQNIIRFVPASDIIAKKEVGVRPYSIKDKMLSTGRKGVKISKKGTLYRDIPIFKEFDTEKPKGNPTDKETEVRKQIQEALSSAKLSLKLIAKTKATGAVSTIMHKKGMVVANMYENEEAYKNKAKPKWQAVLFFRRMSNAPGTSEWRHPGIPGKDITRKIQDWQTNNEKKLFDEYVIELMEAILQ